MSSKIPKKRTLKAKLSHKINDILQWSICIFSNRKTRACWPTLTCPSGPHMPLEFRAATLLKSMCYFKSPMITNTGEGLLKITCRMLLYSVYRCKVSNFRMGLSYCRYLKFRQTKSTNTKRLKKILPNLLPILIFLPKKLFDNFWFS